MQSFRYQPGSSVLHALNPSIKLLTIAAVMIAITFIFDVATPLAFLLLTILAMVVLGRLSLVQVLRSLAPFLVIVLSIVVLNTIFHRPLANETLIFSVGPLNVSWEGLEIGLSIGLRVLFLVSTSLLFVATTEPQEFVLSLVQQAKLGYKLAFALLVAYRFVPLFAEEYANIQAAARVRGIGSGRGFFARVRSLRRDAVPLLASAIRRSERLAVAMDSRAFGAYPTRTYHKTMKVTSADWLFFFGTLSVSAVLLAVLITAGLTRGVGVLFQ
ncbi:MAG: energy-coupling factor transporter transmembrane protein EcfT [Chloroflexota bacterium]|nr:energy-coupling factor transporter transmembrane protein EcfT [Chloroflexota bacterium]MDQ5864101.1 energy-coupling factor transporter transmembrane protein EcfT [Chloroflexota bacterium]